MRDSQFIHPSSIRVWRGFRNASYQQDREGFVNKLADIFIPLTCQAMMPIGLRSYIPTLIRSDVAGMPDEIALVGYSDQQTYYSASHDTVIGRAYGLLHDEVFNFASTGDISPSHSGFPVCFSSQPLKLSQPYYFAGHPIDWSATPVTVYVVPVNDEAASTRLTAALQVAVQSNLITEAILVQDSDYYVLWMALKSGGMVPDDIKACMSGIAGVVTSSSAPASVPAMWTEKEGGIPIRDNETLNLTLSSKSVWQVAS